jgi:hypothetical protein
LEGNFLENSFKKVCQDKSVGEIRKMMHACTCGENEGKMNEK